MTDTGVIAGRRELKFGFDATDIGDLIFAAHGRSLRIQSVHCSHGVTIECLDPYLAIKGLHKLRETILSNSET